MAYRIAIREFISKEKGCKVYTEWCPELQDKKDEFEGQQMQCIVYDPDQEDKVVFAGHYPLIAIEEWLTTLDRVYGPNPKPKKAAATSAKDGD